MVIEFHCFQLAVFVPAAHTSMHISWRRRLKKKENACCAGGKTCSDMSECHNEATLSQTSIHILGIYTRLLNPVTHTSEWD